MNLPAEARFLFVDGPVAVFISEASPQAIIEAYTRLEQMVRIAARQLGENNDPPYQDG